MFALPPPDPPVGPLSIPACAWWQQADQLGLDGSAARPLERFPCDPIRVVHRVAARVAAECARREVELVEVTPKTPSLVIDPWRLDLALSALAHSALRAARASDRLVLGVLPEPTQVAFVLATDPRDWRPRLEHALTEGGPGRDGANPREALDRLALRMARRAAEDHLGSIELLLEPMRVQLALRVPIDPERP